MRDVVQQHAAAFERRLQQVSEPGMIADILTPVLTGGKHLRPVLCLLVAETLGGDVEQAMRSALALEMIHCGALLHDDVYDRDQLRRGAPTLWTQLGDRAAMLLGDLMLGTAFQTMPESGLSVLARCVGDLSRASFHEMFRPQCPTADDGLATILGKTASLFRAACHLGGLAGPVPPSVILALADYGEHVGIAFQIADDLADIRRSLEEQTFVGDLRARVASFPLLSAGLPDGVLQRYVSGEALDERGFLQVLRDVGCESTAHRQIAEHQAAALTCLEPLADPGPLREFPFYAVEQLLSE